MGFCLLCLLSYLWSQRKHQLVIPGSKWGGEVGGCSLTWERGKGGSLMYQQGREEPFPPILIKSSLHLFLFLGLLCISLWILKTFVLQYEHNDLHTPWAGHLQGPSRPQPWVILFQDIPKTSHGMAGRGNLFRELRGDQSIQQSKEQSSTKRNYCRVITLT